MRFFLKIIDIIFVFAVVFCAGLMIFWDKSEFEVKDLASVSGISILNEENNEIIESKDDFTGTGVADFVSTQEDLQDILDDIAEKLDIIQQQVNELIAEKNPEEEVEDKSDKELDEEELEEEENLEEKEEKVETENNQIVYLKILISETKIDINNRFVKLFNPNDIAVDLTDWYLQRRTTSSPDYTSCISKNDFSGKIILPHSYFLISRNDSFANIFMPDLVLTLDNFLVLKNPNGEISDSKNTEQAPIISGGSGGNSTAICENFNNILISEIQIEGEENKDDDWVELYNPNEKDACLSGWSIQKASKTGKISRLKNFSNSAAISANSYFLIVNSDANQELKNLSDMTCSGLNLSAEFAGGNTIYLVKSKDECENGEDIDIVDKVGYGLAVDYKIFPALKPSIGKTTGRIWDEELQNYKNTNNNLEDFELQKPTPKFQNIAWQEPILPTLESIEITTSPSKTVFFVGEELDISDLEITGYYSDGSSKIETISEKNITGFDSTSPTAMQVLTINFRDFTVNYSVEIIKRFLKLILPENQEFFAGIPAGKFRAELQDDSEEATPSPRTLEVDLFSDLGGKFFGGTDKGDCAVDEKKESITISRTNKRKYFCYQNDEPGIFQIKISAVNGLLSDFQEIEILETTSPSNEF